MAIQLLTSSKSASDRNVALAKKSLDILLARTDIDFFRVPQMPELWDETKKLAEELRQNYSQLVVVGIGGSSLGPRAIHEIFYESSQAHQVHFCDNTDVVAFERLLQSISDLKKTAWVFISKSGSTLETLAAYDFTSQFYDKKGVSFIDQTYFVTEKKSNPLFNWAKQHQRPILEIPLQVGGRFSVLTPVGMLPAAFMGLDIEAFRKGALSAISMKERIVSVSAYSLESFDRQEWITLFWHYSSLMKNFGGWIQQLWAESLAKAMDRNNQTAKRASTPISAIGACDQHSILQQVVEGSKDKLVIFIRIGSAESSVEVLKQTAFPDNKYLINKGFGQILAAEAEATSIALTQSGVSNLVLYVPDLSEKTVGFLFMFWQMVVGTVGEAMNINAFDQPGVELGKRLAKQLLSSSKLS